MNRILSHAVHAVLAAGFAVLCWVAAGYVGYNLLALSVTALIGAFYLVGALELHRFRQSTAGLVQAVSGLSAPPPGLGAWLDRLHPSMRQAVRLRIEGERVGLPGPALTPYLAGLLVLLGMTGTFLGMVVTLKGTGLALDSATDLESVRASLAAPVKGLGLAFGTSVAGVAASAMLGLASALCRRERIEAGQLLDGRIATSLRVFSLAHQREESFRLLEQQTQAMPVLVERLQQMMHALEQRATALDDGLQARQERFLGQAENTYAALAASVGDALRHSLGESARIAATTLQPLAESTMAGIAREAAQLHGKVADNVERQLDVMASRFEAEVAKRDEERLAAWTGSLAALAQDTVQQARAHAGAAVEQTREMTRTTLEQAREMTQAMLDQTRDMTGTSLEQVRVMTRTGLEETRELTRTTLDETRELTRATAEQTSELSRVTSEELRELLGAAAEAPRAAAEVIAELRQKLDQSLARDDRMLEERGRIAEMLGQLLQKLEVETGNIGAVAAQITGSAVEVASLGESFGVAVEQFGQSNAKLIDQLQRIEGTLARSIARSDEQLAYYVAQAREVIDLSIMSQKQIVDDLQQMAGRQLAESGAA